jgi:hypothetical protein
MTLTELADRIAATAAQALPSLLVEVAGDGPTAAYAASLMRQRLPRPATGPALVVALYVSWPTLTTVACKVQADNPLWFASLELHPDAIVDGRVWVGPMTAEQLERLDSELPSQRSVLATFDPSDPPGYVAMVWELYQRRVDDPRAVALAVLCDTAH